MFGTAHVAARADRSPSRPPRGGGDPADRGADGTIPKARPMTYATGTPCDVHSYDLPRLPRRQPRGATTSGSVALACGVLLAAGLFDTRPAAGPGMARAPASPPATLAAWNANAALLAPAPLAGFSPVSLAQSVPRGSTFEFAPPSPVASAEAEAVPAPPRPVIAQSTPDIPLPAARPPAFRTAIRQMPLRVAGRRVGPQNRPGASPETPPDNRSFIEKLFGLPQPAGPVLGYAAPELDLFGTARRLTSNPTSSYDRWTVVYDISAHTVYMPGGARLEAHSGLGDKLDDPRHVDVQDRGATPPQIYDLTLREQLFHGVRALRLNPVGGGGIYGRTGLLAHTYMLGPKGDSNGCVSFRNYDAFLQAYQAGEVKRLVVVARLS